MACDTHIKHHTSHITHHTSRITSHITHHTSHITHHTSHITHHKSHIEFSPCKNGKVNCLYIQCTPLKHRTTAPMRNDSRALNACNPTRLGSVLTSLTQMPSNAYENDPSSTSRAPFTPAIESMRALSKMPLIDVEDMPSNERSKLCGGGSIFKPNPATCPVRRTIQTQLLHENRLKSLVFGDIGFVTRRRGLNPRIYVSLAFSAAFLLGSLWLAPSPNSKLSFKIRCKQKKNMIPDGLCLDDCSKGLNFLSFHTHPYAFLRSVVSLTPPLPYSRPL